MLLFDFVFELFGEVKEGRLDMIEFLGNNMFLFKLFLLLLLLLLYVRGGRDLLFDSL